VEALAVMRRLHDLRRRSQHQRDHPAGPKPRSFVAPLMLMSATILLARLGTTPFTCKRIPLYDRVLLSAYGVAAAVPVGQGDGYTLRISTCSCEDARPAAQDHRLPLHRAELIGFCRAGASIEALYLIDPRDAG